MTIRVSFFSLCFCIYQEEKKFGLLNKISSVMRLAKTSLQVTYNYEVSTVLPRILSGKISCHHFTQVMTNKYGLNHETLCIIDKIIVWEI
jgi:hypothetical protein